MQRFLKVVLLICCFVFSKQSFSQDIRGGSIDYKWLSGYTYSINTTLLVDSASTQSHTGTVYFGDGDSCVASSSSYVGGKIRVYKFSCIHAYSGPGIFNAYLTDTYRVSGIKNITNSSNKVIWISAYIFADAFLGPSTSPVFPISSYTTSIGSVFNLNLGLFDIDGDSLSYQLIKCFPSPSVFYYYPANCSINTSTGTFTYQADTLGLYAFKFLIKQWRKDLDGNPQSIGFTETDFLLDVKTSVGIKELDKKETITVYPNPTFNILFIRTNSKINSDIEIINSLGQTVLKQNYSNRIDVSKLVPGYYFIKINNSYSKFIKE